MVSVVVVEDEADIAMLVATKFRNAGHAVTVARDGEAGLRAVLESQPDVVLLDVMMPLMDGYTVCQEIRDRCGPTGSPCIVLLSARSQVADRQRGFDAGCDEYVTKPFKPSELLSLVNELLRQRGLA
jgi:DNA-binding response OmpR family regulator